jgi:hypothetical protein
MDKVPAVPGGSQQVKKELAAAFTILDLNEHEGFTYSGLVQLRKMFNRRRVKRSKVANSGVCEK